MSEPVRLYVKGVVTSYRRNHVRTHESCNIIKIQGVQDRPSTEYYLGKRIAYIYKASTGKKLRCIWGKVVGSHGCNGAVRARFATNLPPKALGATVRVMLYPSRV